MNQAPGDKNQAIQDVVPFRMVVPVDFPKKKVKYNGIRKGRTSKKESSSFYEQSEQGLNFFMRDIGAYNPNDYIEYGQHVEPKVGPYGTTSGKPWLPLTKSSPITMNVPILDKSLN